MKPVLSNIYPASRAERDRWILNSRPARNPQDERIPHAFFVEEEHSASGEVVSIATIFLTNRECPWRCVMCDLWRNTLTQAVAVGAIPEQIDFALSRLPAAGQIKIYNSGSFFDPRAVPPDDFVAIASQLRGFDRIIVESHPALIGRSSLRFKELLHGQLEVAMGLETAHPETLAKLNKRMTLEMYSCAADFLKEHEIALRSFILLRPPFMAVQDSVYWAERSIDFAFTCGATAATLIPTRANNGAMELLASAGEFAPPTLKMLAAAQTYGLEARQGRVFADLWDVSSQGQCLQCSPALLARMKEMNMSQKIVEHQLCRVCEPST